MPRPRTYYARDYPRTPLEPITDPVTKERVRQETTWRETYQLEIAEVVDLLRGHNAGNPETRPPVPSRRGSAKFAASRLEDGTIAIRGFWKKDGELTGHEWKLTDQGSRHPLRLCEGNERLSQFTEEQAAVIRSIADSPRRNHEMFRPRDYSRGGVDFN